MSNPPLQSVKIAAPCSAEWRWMTGNDRVRFCSQCSLNVFNLSAMTTQEAEDLLRRTEGRLCVRFYRRSDGTILTRDCPVGLNAIRDRLARIRSCVIAATLSFLGHLGLVGLWGMGDHAVLGETTGRLAIRDGQPTNALLIGPADPRIEIVGEIACPLRLPDPALPVRSESFVRKRAIFKVVPIYHSAGHLQNGDAVVRVVIVEDGTVDSADCVSGNHLFGQLAEEAALGWKFEPILVNGRPARVESRLTFHLGK